MKTVFRISPEWGCIKTLDELIADSKFIFSHKGHHGVRPHIVLNTPIIDNLDCIEISYDGNGLLDDGVSNFHAGWGEIIKDSSKDCYKFISDFLIKDGAKEHILTP
jgi:hypothetical protein